MSPIEKSRNLLVCENWTINLYSFWQKRLQSIKSFCVWRREVALLKSLQFRIVVERKIKHVFCLFHIHCGKNWKNAQSSLLDLSGYSHRLCAKFTWIERELFHVSNGVPTLKKISSDLTGWWTFRTIFHEDFILTGHTLSTLNFCPRSPRTGLARGYVGRSLALTGLDWSKTQEGYYC